MLLRCDLVISRPRSDDQAHLYRLRLGDVRSPRRLISTTNPCAQRTLRRQGRTRPQRMREVTLMQVTRSNHRRVHAISLQRIEQPGHFPLLSRSRSSMWISHDGSSWCPGFCWRQSIGIAASTNSEKAFFALCSRKEGRIRIAVRIWWRCATSSTTSIMKGALARRSYIQSSPPCSSRVCIRVRLRERSMSRQTLEIHSCRRRTCSPTFSQDQSSLLKAPSRLTRLGPYPKLKHDPLMKESSPQLTDSANNEKYLLEFYITTLVSFFESVANLLKIISTKIKKRWCRIQPCTKRGSIFQKYYSDSYSQKIHSMPKPWEDEMFWFWGAQG